MGDTAIQMWTVRNEAARSVPATFGRLKQLGFDAVETAGDYGLGPAGLRRQLDEAGLRLACAHAPLPEPSAAGRLFYDLEELGADAAFCSLGESHWVDDAAIGQAADRFNQAVEAGAAHSVGFGYHNHWWEFSTLVNGRPAYETFLSRIDPRGLLEVDTYWAEVGGTNAAELVAGLGARVQHLHIKDGPVDRKAPQVAVGDGALDIPAIVGANPNVRWNIVELDDYAGDIWEAVERSSAYMASLGAGRA